MSRAYPIPDAALDDRLGWIGTSGSGKTYNAGAGVERLLGLGARVVIVDPLDVWWGLRLDADGTQSEHDVVIFGGEHGDLPLNEHAGKLVGETVANMSESCIISLGSMRTKEAERAFMLAFLESWYRKASGDPVHAIFDEADLWAPQGAGSGSGPKLQSLMEQIVRRGRVKGFVPWLISQRPAVISKDVLSQVDGLVAFKLTSSQDRKAVGDWVSGQADEGEWPKIKAALPTMQRGQGIVWVPAQAILETVSFPRKATFDSSRTPKRGEKRERRDLPSLNLDALKDRLASVEQEAKANDPKALKSEIIKLKRELAAAQTQGRPAYPDLREECDRLKREVGEAATARATAESRIGAALKALGGEAPPRAEPSPAPLASVRVKPAPVVPQRPIAPKPAPSSNGDVSITGPQRHFLGALAWWKSMGHDRPSKAQVAAIAGWKVTSGHIKNVAGSLRSAGLIDYPLPGHFSLTETGFAEAPAADSSLSFHDQLRGTLTGPQKTVFDVVTEHGELSRDDLAIACGWEPTSGHVKNVLGSMRTLEVIDYPGPGRVALQDWVASA